MTFGPIFPAVFSKTFTMQMGGAWWNAFGAIPTANCIAAYKAKGAASLAASYVNLATPGINDAAPGTAPSFATATGWTFSAASSQYLNIGSSAIITTTPLTIACLFNPDDITGSYALASICRTSVEDNRFQLYIFDLAPKLAISSRKVTGANAITSTSYSAGNWFVGVGVIVNNISRSAYLNAAGKVTDTNDRTPTGLNATYIGVRHNATALGAFLNGKIGALAFYNIAFSDAQVTSLTTYMNAL